MMIDGINRMLPAQSYFYQKDICIDLHSGTVDMESSLNIPKWPASSVVKPTLHMQCVSLFVLILSWFQGKHWFGE